MARRRRETGGAGGTARSAAADEGRCSRGRSSASAPSSGACRRSAAVPRRPRPRWASGTSTTLNGFGWRSSQTSRRRRLHAIRRRPQRDVREFGEEQRARSCRRDAAAASRQAGREPLEAEPGEHRKTQHAEQGEPRRDADEVESGKPVDGRPQPDRRAGRQPQRRDPEQRVKHPRVASPQVAPGPGAIPPARRYGRRCPEAHAGRGPREPAAPRPAGPRHARTSRTDRIVQSPNRQRIGTDGDHVHENGHGADRHDFERQGRRGSSPNHTKGEASLRAGAVSARRRREAVAGSRETGRPTLRR